MLLHFLPAKKALTSVSNFFCPKKFSSSVKLSRNLLDFNH